MIRQILHSRRSVPVGLAVLAFVSVLVVLGLLGALSYLTSAFFTDSTAVGGNSFTTDTLDPPTGLTATGGSTASLDWTTTVDTYASGHRVLRSTTTGGPYSQITEVTPRTTTTYTDSPADGTYYYVLRSYFQNWESANSNEDSATVGGGAVTILDAWTTGLTHTVGAGSDRLLLFAVGYENGSDPGVSTVTYGGQSLTQIVGAVAGTTTVGRVELWYLNEAGIVAAVGSTFTVTWGGTAPSNPMYAAATYEGVDQTTPIYDSSFNSTDTSIPNPITTVVNVVTDAMAVSAAISGNDGSYTWGGSWAEGTDQTAGTTTTMSSADDSITAAGTDTASATHSGPNRQAIVAAVLGPAAAPEVQSGTATSTGGTCPAPGGCTTSVTINSVDPAKSVLFFHSRHNSNRPPGSMIRGRILNSTTLEFVRVTDETSTMTIRWYVVEFPSGVAVQRGEISSQSATTINVPITAVASVSQAFVTWSKTPNDNGGTMSSDDPILCELTTTANLQCRVNGTNPNHIIWWQVVEFTNPADINVQKGSTSLLGTALSTTATLGTPVDVTKTFVLAGYRTAGRGADIGTRMLRARLTSSTTIEIDRSIYFSPGITRANAWTTGLTHTAGGGNNRLLLFAVGYENGSDPGVSTVTYGGQSLTRIVGAVAGTTTIGRVELWYVNEAGIAAAIGTTFSVTWGGVAPTYPMYAAATYADVNQSSPILDSSSNFTNSSTPNPITTSVNVVDGAMAVSGAISGNNGSYTWGGGWTEGTDQASGTTTTMSSAENAATADVTDTASATHSGPNRQAVVAAAFNPADDDITEIVWQAVEFKDGSTVQRGSENFAIGVAQKTVPITSVVTDRAVVFGSVQPVGGQNMGRSPYAGDDIIGVCSVAMSLSSTDITMNRNNTADSCDIGWFVVEFPP